MTRQEAQRRVVLGLLQNSMKILEAKNQDYSADDDAFSNFRFTGLCLDYAIQMGVGGPHLAFLALIATKLARLFALVGGGKVPRNEAIEDTCVDLANYAALWGGFLLAGKETHNAWVKKQLDKVEEYQRMVAEVRASEDFSYD